MGRAPREIFGLLDVLHGKSSIKKHHDRPCNPAMVASCVVEVVSCAALRAAPLAQLLRARLLQGLLPHPLFLPCNQRRGVLNGRAHRHRTHVHCARLGPQLATPEPWRYETRAAVRVRQRAPFALASSLCFARLPSKKCLLRREASSLLPAQRRNLLATCLAERILRA